MAKVKKNFRLSEAALLDLARLMGLWGCDATAAVERALREVDPSEMDREERESTQAVLEDAVVPSALPEVRGLHPPKRLQKMQGSVTNPRKLEYPSYEKRGGEVRPVPKGRK